MCQVSAQLALGTFDSKPSLRSKSCERTLATTDSHLGAHMIRQSDFETLRIWGIDLALEGL